MTEDARFEDGADAPLNIGAFDGEDLKIIAALVQDAVLPITEIRYDPSQRRLALLINRFRWEDLSNAEKRDRSAERVQSLLVVSNVIGMSSMGIDRSDKDAILSILDISFSAVDDVAGDVTLTLAGDGALRAKVEALELRLKDVTRPYVARAVPSHKD